MAIWGVNISAVKVMTTHFHPLLMSCLRMSIASVVIGVTVAVATDRPSLRKISASQWLRLISCALLMVYGNQLLLSTGLESTSASNGAIIMALGPLVATLLAAAVFRERLTLFRIVGIVIGFGGVAAVVLSRPGATLAAGGWGDLLVFGAMATFVAGGMLIQSLARQFDTLFISSVIYILGSLFLALHVALAPSVMVDTATLFPGLWPWLLLLFSAVVATAAGNMIWNQAIARLGAARATLYQYWIPVFGVGFALLFLGEVPRIWHAVGLFAVLSGTYLGTRRPSTPSRSIK
jgi:drug/metabolite transporter (DMT)-like permease